MHVAARLVLSELGLVLVLLLLLSSSLLLLLLLVLQLTCSLLSPLLFYATRLGLCLIFV